MQGVSPEEEEKAMAGWEGLVEKEGRL